MTLIIVTLDQDEHGEIIFGIVIMEYQCSVPASDRGTDRDGSDLGERQRGTSRRVPTSGVHVEISKGSLCT